MLKAPHYDLMGEQELTQTWSYNWFLYSFNVQSILMALLFFYIIFIGMCHFYSYNIFKQVNVTGFGKKTPNRWLGQN